MIGLLIIIFLSVTAEDEEESVTDIKMEGYLHRKPTMDAPNKKSAIR